MDSSSSSSAVVPHDDSSELSKILTLLDLIHKQLDDVLVRLDALEDEDVEVDDPPVGNQSVGNSISYGSRYGAYPKHPFPYQQPSQPLRRTQANFGPFPSFGPMSGAYYPFNKK